MIAATANANPIPWIGGSGNWSNGSHWAGGKAPGTGIFGFLDSAAISTFSPVNVTLDLGLTIQQLDIGLIGAAPGQFDVLNLGNLSAGSENIGSNGAGVVTHAGGSVSV